MAARTGRGGRAPKAAAPKRPARPSSPDEKLARYRSMRHFDQTPEPSGGPGDASAGAEQGPTGLEPGEVPPGAWRRFVVQHHRARAEHYDVRFEIDGVLASWAVPKGPSLDPEVKRLAVHVEDHPMEYIDFEGVIPHGQYGGGDVTVWDRGTWEPHGTDDPARSVAKGELHAEMFGEKLRGRLVLVRRGNDRSGKEQWLLFHKHDEEAVPGWRPEDHPRSVKSGRTNDEVAADPDALWQSGAPAATAEVNLRSPAPAPASRPEGREWAPPTPDELAALDALKAKGEWVLGGRTLSLTNLDKTLFPARAGDERGPVTKRDLIRYFACIAPVLLPHLVDRPLNLHRYPNGADRPGFWHKEVPSHAPEWLRRWHNPDADPGETQWYFVADHPAALAWLANYGALEIHPWTSTTRHSHQPTYALIDVDPGTSTTFDDVVVLTRLYRTALEHLGVRGYPKVTGQRGIQIWVPIAPGPSFDDTRQWVEAISVAIGRTVPELVSWAWEVRARQGRARLDYTQNAINKTLVAPYSTRPAPGAPVSAPITWDELDDPALRPDRWTVRTIFDRLARVGDLFEGASRFDQVLPDLQ